MSSPYPSPTIPLCAMHTMTSTVTTSNKITKRHGSLLKAFLRLIRLSRALRLILKPVWYIQCKEAPSESVVWIAWPERTGSWQFYHCSRCAWTWKKTNSSKKVLRNCVCSCFRAMMSKCIRFWGITRHYGTRRVSFRVSYTQGVHQPRVRSPNSSIK